MTTYIGELQMVSKHSLINGLPSDKADKNSPKQFVRDCGCAFRFTTSFRKNRLRTAVRVRKAVRSQSLNKTTDDVKINKNIVPEPVSDSKKMGADSVTNVIKNSGLKRYTVNYFYDYKPHPTLYKTTLTIPIHPEEVTFKEEICFTKKIFTKRVIESVTTEVNLPIYKATVHINCNTQYINLDNLKNDEIDSEC